MIHRTDNIVVLPRQVHIRVSAEMSRNMIGTNSTRRIWMERFEFDAQFDLGLDLIEKISKEFK